MFIEKDDLGSVIYSYQIEDITEGDDNLVAQACAAAIEEAKSYLTPNIKTKQSFDGRLLYDVEAIFSAEGTDRNSLILQHCATLAKWHLVTLCNADVIYEQAKDRYDRAIDWFTKIAKGTINLTGLPQLTISPDTETAEAFYSGSRTKFIHE
ncbi:MAG: DUF1320 family protein [Bacteroidetes bacterium]|nr:DUF1320 family protein [Bacteroidota bacterium]